MPNRPFARKAGRTAALNLTLRQNSTPSGRWALRKAAVQRSASPARAARVGVDAAVRHRSFRHPTILHSVHANATRSMRGVLFPHEERLHPAFCESHGNRRSDVEFRSRCAQVPEGFNHFVSSIVAPVLPAGAVAGWGLHPLEKRRLCTAHAISSRSVVNRDA
jgi:hypothetical protein